MKHALPILPLLFSCNIEASVYHPNEQETVTFSSEAEEEVTDLEVKARGIIGDDYSRYQITESSVTSRRTGALEVKFPHYEPNEVSNCTATYISSNMLITAAHCVYKEQSGYPTSVQFYPERLDINTTKWGIEFIDKIYLMSEYKRMIDGGKSHSRSRWDHDIALLRVYNHGGDRDNLQNNNVGWHVPFFYSDTYENTQDGAYNTWDVDIFSYPADQDPYTLWHQDDCQMQRVSDLAYQHDCDTSSGSSGAALITLHPRFTPERGEMYITAIHTGYSHLEETNYAARITQARWITINDIVKQKQSVFDPKMFTTTEIDPAPYTSLEFRNECHRSVYLAYRYQDLNGDWKTQGYFTLPPDKRIMSAIKTRNSRYYLWAVDKHGNYLLNTRDRSIQVHNDYRDMEERSLTTDNRSYYKRLTCD